MKNFKLLLATTAILSTAFVSMVDAGPITQNFDVKVRLITFSADLGKVNDLNFGNVFVRSVSEAGQTVMLAPDGTVTGTAEHYGQAQPALLYMGVSGVPLADYDISVTSDGVLRGTVGETSKICGNVSGWQHTKFAYTDASRHVTDSIGFNIGATFTLPDSAHWDFREDLSELVDDYLDCTGTATATLIYIGAN